MSMDSELRSCPFCGGDDVVIDYKAGITGNMYFISCYGGGIHGCVAQDYSYATKREAIKAWNTRHESAAANRGVDEAILAQLVAEVIGWHPECDAALRSSRRLLPLLAPYLTQQDRVEATMADILLATGDHSMREAVNSLRAAGFTITRDSKG